MTGQKSEKGFTLVELLAVLFIVSLLLAIMLPALGRVRARARAVAGVNNQRSCVGGVTQYALDRNGRYPQSVATIGTAADWHWQEPMILTGFNKRDPQLHRSMSGYLRDYIEDADILYCPSAPRKYKYLQEAWDAGDKWDNPDPLTMPLDPVVGTYCFYWNYIGYLEERGRPFYGPRTIAGRRGQSTMLVSDFFGRGHWRSREAWGRNCHDSCEKFYGADITPGTSVSSAYWSRPIGSSSAADMPEIILHAGYTDGRVEAFRSTEVRTLKVSITSDGTVPYTDGIGPGIFCLPPESLH